MSEKVAPPKNMFRAPDNRQPRKHPILLLGSLGTQKKQGAGYQFFKMSLRRTPWGPPNNYIPIFKKIGSQGVPGVPGGKKTTNNTVRGRGSARAFV